MTSFRSFCLLLFLLSSLYKVSAQETKSVTPSPQTNLVPASNAVLTPPQPQVGQVVPDDLVELSDQPQAVQDLVRHGLELAQKNLKYTYGSDDPSAGGMDCSGTVYYLLQQAGLKDVPRDASEMYQWVWQNSRFESVVSPNLSTFELSRLKVGDLLFWTGTYQVDRDPPVTHVMIYLGKRKNGTRVMLGASEGRTFSGIPRYGVGVFDFTLPKAHKGSGEGSRFIGYGPIPGLVAVDKVAGNFQTNSRGN